MESFKEYVEGLKKEKEERLEEDVIDEIADRVAQRLHPVIPQCSHCPYSFYCPYFFYCPYNPYHTYSIAWRTYPNPITWQTYPVNPTDSIHTYNSWRHGEGEKDE